jgi:hypothetical protein
MSVANSLIKPTYPPQPTQAGYTIKATVGDGVVTGETEIVRQRLTPGIWLMTASLRIEPTATPRAFQFGIRLDGLPYNAVTYYESLTNGNSQNYNLVTPFLVLETNDLLMIGSSPSESLTLEGDGTLVQFTRLS